MERRTRNAAPVLASPALVSAKPFTDRLIVQAQRREAVAAVDGPKGEVREGVRGLTWIKNCSFMRRRS